MAKAKRVCAVEGCAKQSREWGYCKAHGMRFYRHGSPLAGRVSRGAPLDWLLAHVGFESEDCLRWPFGRTGAGYGQLKAGEAYVGAHREMCRRAHGEPPSQDHEAAHSCGQGHEGCVNPGHLRWATASENSIESVRHGTKAGLFFKGERHPNAKLSDADVISIRQHLRRGQRVGVLAEMFGAAPSTISQIKAGTSWRHLL